MVLGGGTDSVTYARHLAIVSRVISDKPVPSASIGSSQLRPDR
jgi:hypothetical protein